MVTHTVNYQRCSWLPLVELGSSHGYDWEILVGSLNNDSEGYKNITSKAKSRCFKLYPAYFISFNLSKVIWQLCWLFFLDLNSRRLYQGPGKEKEKFIVLCSRPPQKREIRQFHVIVVQWWQRKVQKRVMHVQSCCFAYLSLLLFCRSHWHCSRRC